MDMLKKKNYHKCETEVPVFGCNYFSFPIVQTMSQIPEFVWTEIDLLPLILKLL